jgi:MFS family permease
VVESSRADLAGRLLSVPLAWCVRPVALLSVEFGLACASAVALVAVGQFSYPLLVLSVAGTGLGIAALYPQGLLLAKQRAPLSSVWISRLVVGALVGAVLGPPAVGALLDVWPTCLYYAVLGAVLLQTVCFLLVAMLPRYEHRSGSEQHTQNQQCELEEVAATAVSASTVHHRGSAGSMGTGDDVAARRAAGSDEGDADLDQYVVPRSVLPRC